MNALVVLHERDATEAKLRAIIRQQGERIEELEAVLGLKLELPPAIRLTNTQREMLGLLLSRQGIVRRDTFYTVLYAARPDCDWPEAKIIDVQMCKLRSLIKRACLRAGIAPIEIGTDWGNGYFLTAENKARLRALIGGEA